MAGYQTTTFGQLQTELSTRLADPTNHFWSLGELQFYIREALQVWQAFSQFYTNKAQLVTTSGTLFYNITQLIPELTPSITDRDLIQQIQYHLQEPLSPTSWVGSEQFTFQGVVQAIQNRRDRFTVETGLVQTISEIPGPPPPSGLVPLADSIIDVRRVMWKSRPFGFYSILWRMDEFAMTGGNPSWFNIAGLPTDYSTTLNQPLSLQLMPAPIDAGNVHLITVNSGPILNPTSQATVLGVPNDFVWVVKFGALADLFSQPGPGEDPSRAAYCEARWKDGIELARITNFIKFGYQNGMPAFVDALDELDSFTPTWVSGASGVPKNLAVGGNIAATNPIPDGQYSLMFDVIPNMILPAIDDDFVQVGQEFLDIILDYAQHLARFKEGSLELKNSYQLYQNFVKMAAVENDRLRAASNNFDVLSDRSLREAHEKPRRKSDIALQELTYA